jgi:hypothetical protein
MRRLPVRRSLMRMGHPGHQNGFDEAVALEANAACAGLALACAYSSSDEYEAEIIQARRKAGAYRAPHHRQAYIAVALTAAAIAGVLLAL